MNSRSKRPNRIFLPGILLVLVLVSLNLGVTHPVARAEGEESPLLTSEQIAAAVLLPVPQYLYYYGSAPTSAAMIAAYYDRNGYPNIYTGPTNGGVMPMEHSTWGTWTDGDGTYYQNPLTASRNGLDGRVIKGTIDDYYIMDGSAAQDPFITGVWTEHAYGTAIGDYMRTGQSNFSLADGVSKFDEWSNADVLTCDTIVGWGGVVSDSSVGRRLFYEARGYTVTDCYNQRTDNLYAGGFSFAQYKAEIDAGRPVLLNFFNGSSLWSVVGVGYDAATSTIWMFQPGGVGYYTVVWGALFMTTYTLDSVSIVTPAIPLSVTKAGTGSGTVSSDPAGIDCGSDCAGDYVFGTVVKLTATASPGSLFTGWSGLCSGLKFCWLTMNAAKSVTATFTTIPPGTYPVTVVKAGTGSGTVTSTPVGISCGSDCWEFYTAGTVVKLTAAASPGSTFVGWSGACGSMDYCWLSMGASKYVTANFILTPPGTYPLIVARKGTGTGKVSSTPAGISCGVDCYQFYTSDTLIKLTADPAEGSDFTGWSGACGGTAFCWVTMSASRFVTATFTLDTATLSPPTELVSSADLLEAGLPGWMWEVLRKWVPIL